MIEAKHRASLFAVLTSQRAVACVCLFVCPIVCLLSDTVSRTAVAAAKSRFVWW